METKAYSYIRISSKNQIKGGGVLRQLEASRAYAEKHGLVLDEELTDIGLSGFHGKHVSNGALGGFLELVNTGKIPRGSVLIVESLDRLSRRVPLVAQHQLTSVLLAGLQVVTLFDNMRYTSDADSSELAASFRIMERAYDESRTKSERSKAAIAARRLDALAGKKGTFIPNLPTWITQTKHSDGTFKRKLNDKVKIVKRIFDMYEGGVGVNSIVRIFNQEQVPRLRPNSQGYHDTVITGILRNEAVIGTLKIGSDRVENFLPAIVKKEQFYRVQETTMRNRNKGRVGNPGENYTNLFTGYAVCHSCGKGIRCKNGGRGDWSYLYYTCSAKFKGFACDAPEGRTTVRAEAIEKAILYNVLIYNLDRDITDNGNRKKIENAIAANLETKVDLETRISNMRTAIETAQGASDVAFFMSRLDALRTEIGGVEIRIEGLKRQLREVDDVQSNFKNINQEIDAEIKSWPSLDTPSLFASRAKVGHSLRKLITEIRVDIPRQEAIVMLGGFTKWWVIGKDGKVKTEADWSGLPLDILLARSKEFFGSKIDAQRMREVYDGLETPKQDPALWNNKRKARGLPMVEATA